MKDVLVAALTADDQLDDIGRARMWARLEDRLAPAPRRKRAWFAVAACAIAAAIAVVVLVPRRADAPMIAPADATLTARLGPFTRASLVGPAQLRVVGEPGEVTIVRLERGTLLADFAGGPGRALDIVAPGMRVSVVGTLFAVEIRATTTCVSVAHGRVQVAIGVRVAAVATGEHLCASDAAPTPIEPRVEQALEHHALVTADGEIAKPQLARTEPAPGPLAVAPTPEVVAPSPPVVAPSTPPPLVTSHATPRPIVRPRNARTPAIAANEQRSEPSLATSEPPKSEPAMSQPPNPEPPKPAATSQPPKSEPSKSQSAISQPSKSEPPKSEPAKPQSPKPEPAKSEPAKPAATGDELYRSAEAALARNDVAAADRALATLLANEPTSPLRAQALYDRARIAYDRRAWAAARAHLAALAAITDSPLAESGHYLTCRIAVESRDASAARCLRDFRSAYPRSPHDRDVLATLAQLAHASGGCTAAHAYTSELAQRYPHSTLAAAWRDKCPESK